MSDKHDFPTFGFPTTINLNVKSAFILSTFGVGITSNSNWFISSYNSWLLISTDVLEYLDYCDLELLEKIIISYRLGLINNTTLTSEEISKKINLNLSLIIELESSAIRKIKTSQINNGMAVFIKNEIELIEKYNNRNSKRNSLKIICSILNCSENEFFEVFNRLEIREKNLIIHFCGSNFEKNNFKRQTTEQIFRFNEELVPQMKRMLEAIRNMHEKEERNKLMRLIKKPNNN